MTKIDEFWIEWKRVIKDNGAIVMTASQPFTSKLVMSNLKWFKYEWVYQKRCASNFAQAKYAPMKEHENVIVFSNGKPKYNPIKEKRKGSGNERAKYKYTDASRANSGEFVGNMIRGAIKNDSGNNDMRYPSSVQEFNNRASGDRSLHPTQKPVALGQYLIKTYTEEGDTVFDGFAGSGTTMVACQNIKRNFIGVEISSKYCEIIRNRLKQKTLI